MASTNKTTNYQLSQYVGTDKPTYLGDYNNDMLKIDTAIKNNSNNIESVSETANTANTNANTASTNANTALSNSTTAINTANTANSTANSALAKAVANEGAINNFNLTSFSNVTVFNKTASGTIRPNSQINIATNTDGSLAKIYGQITISGVTNSDQNLGKITFSTPLRPSEELIIAGGIICANYNSAGTAIIGNYLKEFKLKTNGDIEVSYNYVTSSGEMWRAMFINSLIFVKNFGDTPIPE